MPPRFRHNRKAWFACGILPVLLLLAWAPAQNPQVEAHPNPAFPTVTFSWARWAATPPEYTLSVAAGGNSTYQSTPRSVARTGAPYTVQFVVSQATRQEIFDLVQELNFLDIPSKDGLLSAKKESVKTISFRQGDAHHEIIYQSTKNPRVEDLAGLFESISSTLEFGRRLANLHRQSGAGLSSELSRMRSMAAKGQLPELQAVTSVLQEIASDPSLKQSVRERARAIMRLAP